MITKYNQYRNDFFNKLRVDFEKGKKILDVGCGDGSDAQVFRKSYGLDFYGIDIYKNPNIKKNKLNFKIGTIHKIPYKSECFDYVYAHDVLHHIEEKNLSDNSILLGLKELRRVCKKNGCIVIVEANRYNPLFYPHMVLMKKHNHLTKSRFKRLVKEEFKKDNILFKFFEAHLYPAKLIYIFKIYEYFAEKIFPKWPLAYNCAVIIKIS
ncbi:MAG: class I SAM-dependent methyltransferase [Candidatus Levyibacteriota bacterium]